ncbi:MAG: trypsin-like serine protease [Pseudomonadota bacterium]
MKLQAIGIAIATLLAIAGCQTDQDAQQSGEDEIGQSSMAVSNGDINWGYSTAGMIDIQECEGSPCSYVTKSACTGTLIGRRTVLTASHCLFSVPPTNRADRFVFKLYNSSGSVVLSRTTSDSVKHPNWDWGDLEDDVALLRFSSDITTVVGSQISLDSNTPQLDDTVTLVGFGQYIFSDDCECQDVNEDMAFCDFYYWRYCGYGPSPCNFVVWNGSCWVPDENYWDAQCEAEKAVDCNGGVKTVGDSWVMDSDTGSFDVDGDPTEDGDSSLCHGDSGGPTFASSDSSGNLVIGVHSQLLDASNPSNPRCGYGSRDMTVGYYADSFIIPNGGNDVRRDRDNDGYVFGADGTDCDDTRANVNPSATEVCGDGLDNDCNGSVDALIADKCAWMPTITSTTSFNFDTSSACIANDYQGSSADTVYALSLASQKFVTISTAGSSFDTYLYLLSGGSCPGTTEIASSDDYQDFTSQISGNFAAGTYWIVVEGYGDNEGPGTLAVTIQDPKPMIGVETPVYGSGTTLPAVVNVVYDYEIPTDPFGDGILTVYARGDLGSTTEYIDVYIDGVNMGRKFNTSLSDCTTSFYSATITIPSSQLETFAADGRIEVQLRGSTAVNYCSPNYLSAKLLLDYDNTCWNLCSDCGYTYYCWGSWPPTFNCWGCDYWSCDPYAC